MTQTSTYRADSGDILTLTYPEWYTDNSQDRVLDGADGRGVAFSKVVPVTEPTGLGAVVEAGAYWFPTPMKVTHVGSGDWIGPDGDTWTWADLEDPTVLSPGYDG